MTFAREGDAMIDHEEPGSLASFPNGTALSFGAINGVVVVT